VNDFTLRLELGGTDWYLDEVKSHIRLQFKNTTLGEIQLRLPNGEEAPDTMRLGEFIRLWGWQK